MLSTSHINHAGEGTLNRAMLPWILFKRVEACSHALERIFTHSPEDFADQPGSNPPAWNLLAFWRLTPFAGSRSALCAPINTVSVSNNFVIYMTGHHASCSQRCIYWGASLNRHFKWATFRKQRGYRLSFESSSSWRLLEMRPWLITK